MSEKPTTKRSRAEIEKRSESEDTDWERLRTMSDQEAHERAARDPDAPPTDSQFWQSAKITWPQGKTKISLYLDNDVLDWFRKGGRGYQTRLNAVLRAYVEAQKPANSAG